jgi:hypothetical protein
VCCTCTELTVRTVYRAEAGEIAGIFYCSAESARGRGPSASGALPAVWIRKREGFGGRGKMATFLLFFFR